MPVEQHVPWSVPANPAERLISKGRNAEHVVIEECLGDCMPGSLHACRVALELALGA